MKTKRRVIRLALAAVMVAGAAAWAGQPEGKGRAAPEVSPRAQMKEIQKQPPSPGRSLPRTVRGTPDSVTWVDAPPVFQPGAKVALIEGDPSEKDRLFTLWLKLPAGYRIAPHFHPADEHLTVLEGEFRIGMGEKFEEGALQALPAGSYIAMPKGHAHFAMASQETVIQLHGIGPWKLIYLDPKDDPQRGVGGAGQEPGR